MNYDDAKDEIERIVDDDRWLWSIYEAKLYFTTRWLHFAYLGVALIGLKVLAEPWQRALILVVVIFVLFSYSRSYGYGIKNAFTGLRGLFWRGVQDQARGQADHHDQ